MAAVAAPAARRKLRGDPPVDASHRPRRRFGQHFLHDLGVVARVVAAVAPRGGDRLVEIGPGRGVLTWPLLAAAGRLTAIELDRDLAAALRAEPAAACGALTLIEADALRVDWRALRGDGAPLRVVGNLPYNISTPLLFALLAHAEAIRDMHFMLQKDVVRRLAAAPGGGDYGRLSVMVQYYCNVAALFDVGPGAFVPPPKVQSAVVRLLPRAPDARVEADPRRLETVVAQAFSQRRKTLRNSLKTLFTADAIAAAGIDPGARPETLSLDDFARLSARLNPV